MTEINKECLVYLAGPYTHPNKGMLEYRFAQLTLASALLVKDYGLSNISPITQSHLQAKSEDLPTTWAFWKEVDLVMLRKCDMVFVLLEDGWKESVGVQAEVAFAEEHDIPVAYVKLVDNKLFLI